MFAFNRRLIDRTVGRVILLLVLYFALVTACGGGVMPYVPSGYSGSASGSSSNTQDKNFIKYANPTVSDEVFNIEQLQPLLRRIRESGNERKKSEKVKKGKKKKKGKKEEKEGKERKDEKNEKVLNFYRIHL